MKPRMRTRRCFPVFVGFALALAAMAIFPLCASAAGEGVDSLELVEKPDAYDGRTVVYTGEVVGVVLERGDNAWITVNDDHYGGNHLREYAELKGGNTGLGVYITSGMADEIGWVGSYTAAGDIVSVEGTFYAANPEHGGDLMIEAKELTVVRRGRPVTKHNLGKEPWIAVVLGLVSIVLGLLLLGRGRAAFL